MLSKHVLVVDDAKDWRDQLRSILERGGYKVDTAEDYQDALTKINRNPAELVLVDLRLDPADDTNRDGLVLLQKLAQMRINAVVITGYGSPAVVKQAESLEVITVIEKSHLSKLRTIINTIFSEMEARDRRRAEAAHSFAQGKAVGYSTEAAGYPLREALSRELEKVVNGSI